MGLKTIFLMFAIVIAAAGTVLSQQSGYLSEWDDFRTKLIRKEKSFQAAEPLEDGRDGFQLVTYSSDGMILKALLKKGQAAKRDRRPAVVYLHGGFALTYGQMEFTRGFSEAGFVVLAPSWRGENSNPGHFELFLGEVRDAKAAVRWLAKQDYVDPERIYIFGWSVGGGIALNLSLHGDIPVRLSGSSAGIYDRELIRSWATEDDYIKFPYDHTDERENYFRLPIYNLKSMVRPHIAFVGSEDGYDDAAKLLADLYPDQKTRLDLRKLAGDHVSSVKPAVEQFIKMIWSLEEANSDRGYSGPTKTFSAQATRDSCVLRAVRDKA
ncbi:MAG: alpha/beta fold hydrolase [Acidobacteriota bacterium]|nr:MAG: alpha/beta fold hydrolase [Acidobacteriota bacterium]